MLAKNIIKNKEIKKALPLIVGRSQIKEFKTTKIKIGKHQSIEKIKIGNTFVIGVRNSKFKSFGLFFICGIIFLLGVLTLLVSVYMLLYNLKVFSETGKLPELPNTVDNKIRGLKFIYKLFNKR